MIFGEGALDLTPCRQPLRMKLSEEEHRPSRVVDAVVLDRSRVIIVDADVENDVCIFRKLIVFDVFDHLYSFFNQAELHGVVYLGIGENPLPPPYIKIRLERPRAVINLLTLVLL